MNRAACLSQLPHQKLPIALIVLLCLAIFVLPEPLSLQKQFEREHINQVLLKEGQVLGIFLGNENFDACEKYWRDELKFHWGDVSRDRLYGIANVRLADLLLRKARYYGQPVPLEAESLYKEGLMVENNLGGELSEIAYAAEALANYLEEKQRYAESEALLKSKMESLKRKLHSHRVMEIASQLADLYKNQKRYSDAIEILNHEFEERKAIGFPICPDPWIRYQSASICYEMGDYAKTVSSCEEAIRIYGPAVTGTTPMRSYLAASLHKLRRTDEAIVQYKLDLKEERQRRIFDGKNWVPVPDTQNSSASDLFAIGEIYIEQQRYSIAQPLLREALDIAQRRLSEKCPAFVRESQLEFVKKIQNSISKLPRS